MPGTRDGTPAPPPAASLSPPSGDDPAEGTASPIPAAPIPISRGSGGRGEARPRFVGFDGVRGVAILLVIVWHGAYVTAFPDAALGLLRPIIMTGWAGVDLFFALSGFLITSLLLHEEEANAAAGVGQRFSVGRFYARRTLRILPAFYAVFLLNTYVLDRFPLFQTIRADAVRASDAPLGLLPYATFWGNYHAGYVRFWFDRPAPYPGDAYDVFWSLCVEEHFYLLWPLLLAAVKPRAARIALAAAVCAALPLLRTIAAARGWDSPAVIHYASHYRVDSLLWGALGALAWCQLPGRPLFHRALLAALLTASLALVLTRALSVRPVGTPAGLGLGFTLLAGAATLLLVDLARAPTSPLARALEWRPLAAVGRLSYGMYLLHFPMIDLGRALFFAVPRAPTLPNLALACIVFTTLSFAAALVLHHAVERPFLKLKDRFFR